MKRIFYLLFYNASFVLCYAQKPSGWKLIFQDLFNGTKDFDSSKWLFCQRQYPAWNKFITQSADYAFTYGSNLVLRMDNRMIGGDAIPYHSGGIKSYKLYLSDKEDNYLATRAYNIPVLKPGEKAYVEIDDLYNGKGIVTVVRLTGYVVSQKSFYWSNQANKT